MNNYFFSDMSVMLGRSMRHISRSMDTISVCAMPIAFVLLFVYVFGGAIQTGTDNYGVKNSSSYSVHTRLIS